MHPHVCVVTGEEEPLKAGLWDIFKKRADESHLHYLKRLCTEGHSVPDAFLTVASSQWVTHLVALASSDSNVVSLCTRLLTVTLCADSSGPSPLCAPCSLLPTPNPYPHMPPPHPPTPRIGQIMLTCPNALWKAGVISGGMFAALTMVWSLFSTFIMNVLVGEGGGHRAWT